MAPVRRLVEAEVLSLSPPAVIYSIDPKMSIKKKTTAAMTNPSWMKLVRKSWRTDAFPPLPAGIPAVFPIRGFIPGLIISAINFKD